MKTGRVAAGCLIVAGAANMPYFVGPQATAEEPLPSAHQILGAFVENFRSDPFAEQPVTFGVRIRGEEPGDWHIVVEGKKPGEGETDVRLESDFPPEGIVYFVMDLDTLRRIHRGDMAEITAAGKARASEVAPVDVDPTPGFNPGDAFRLRFSPHRFRFWTRGLPELVSFDKSHSRVIHGANTVLLYHERGLRTGWMQLDEGQHVNEDPKDQVNNFRSTFVITCGVCQSRIGGVQRALRAGKMLFVPEGVSHESWNDDDEPCEWVDMMFGGGAWPRLAFPTG